MTRYAVIIGTQRSGTTVTRSVLSTHPNIKAFGEVFLPDHSEMRECYYHYLTDRCKENPSYCVPTAKNQEKLFKGYLIRLENLSDGKSLVLFDCKYQFLTGSLNLGVYHQGKPHLLELMRNHNFKLIHLVRRNILATYVSALVSAQTRVWATSNPDKIGDRTVHVDPTTLLSTLNGRKADVDRYTNLLCDENVLSIVYEDLFPKHDSKVNQKTLKAISDYLNIQYQFDIVPEYKKIGLPLNKAIRNYDEVKIILKGTKFEYCLE